jgi:hypothetical protein
MYDSFVDLAERYTHLSFTDDAGGKWMQEFLFNAFVALFCLLAMACSAIVHLAHGALFENVVVFLTAMAAAAILVFTAWWASWWIAAAIVTAMLVAAVMAPAALFEKVVVFLTAIAAAAIVVFSALTTWWIAAAIVTVMLAVAVVASPSGNLPMLKLREKVLSSMDLEPTTNVAMWRSKLKKRVTAAFLAFCVSLRKRGRVVVVDFVAVVIWAVAMVSNVVSVFNCTIIALAIRWLMAP